MTVDPGKKTLLVALQLEETWVTMAFLELGLAGAFMTAELSRT